MTTFSQAFARRRAFSILCLSLLIPLGASLSACSDAAQIPKSEQDRSAGAPAGSPAPQPREAEAEPPVTEISPPPVNGGSAVKPKKKSAAAREPDEEMKPDIVGEGEPEPDARPLEPGAGAPADDEDIAAAPPPPPPPAPAPAPSSPDPAGGSGPPPDFSAGSGAPPPQPSPPVATAPAPTPRPSASAPPKPSATPGGSGDLGLGGIGEGGGGPGSDGGILSRGLGRIGSGSAPSAGAAPPAPEAKPFDIVPVFYGTDRVVEPNTQRLQFSTERGHKLQLGRAMVSVPTAHKVPNIERPWVIELPYFKYKIYEEKEDPAKHFTMQEIAALNKEQLLAYVKERLAKSTNFKDHAFVFVHGFNTSFDAAIYRTAQIAYDLKFDGAPFVYSWPSGGKVASYTYDRGSAEQAEPHLAEFLALVVKESGAKNISLIAHSMGNEILLRVLERMRPSVPDGVVISQVILAAPDVDRDKFTNIARQITDFAKGVTLYAASNDRALGYSARFWGGVPRAGDVPASGPLIVSGVDTIDVTSVSTDGLGLNHSGYAENKVLLDDVGALLLNGVRPPDKRLPSLLKIDTAAGTFWRYPAAAPR